MRGDLEAVRQALQQGDMIAARDIVDALLEPGSAPGLVARPGTVRLLLDVRPREWIVGLDDIVMVDAMARRLDGVPVARGRGFVPDAMHTLGVALGADGDTMEALRAVRGRA